MAKMSIWHGLSIIISSSSVYSSVIRELKHVSSCARERLCLRGSYQTASVYDNRCQIFRLKHSCSYINQKQTDAKLNICLSTQMTCNCSIFSWGNMYGAVIFSPKVSVTYGGQSVPLKAALITVFIWTFLLPFNLTSSFRMQQAAVLLTHHVSN